MEKQFTAATSSPAGRILGPTLALSLLVAAASVAFAPSSEELAPPPSRAVTAAAPASASASEPRQSSEAVLAGYIATRWQVGTGFARQVVRMAYAAADSHSLDPLLVLAVVARESSFRHNGNAGNLEANVDTEEIDPRFAHGLMQVAGRFHPGKMPIDESGGMRVTTDEENLHIGSQILREYLQRDRGNLTRALQRYNGNLTDVDVRFARYVLRVRDQFAKVVAST